jgi:hypothetical protein
MCGCTGGARYGQPPRRRDGRRDCHGLTRERLPAFGDEQPGERVGADRHAGPMPTHHSRLNPSDWPFFTASL